MPVGGCCWPRTADTTPSRPSRSIPNARGTFVYVANQNADSIDCYRIDLESGDLSFTGLTTEVPAPACVVFGPGA